MDSLPILVGITSFNEGENTRTVVRSIATQLEGEGQPFNWILFDDSHDSVSLKILSELAEEFPSLQIDHSPIRKGRVQRLNELAEAFSKSSYSYMLHFNADLRLEQRCVTNLLRALHEGYDFVTGISSALPARSFFERGVRILARMAELSRQEGRVNAPLSGHFAGYSSRGARLLFPLPIDGSAEDLVMLGRAIEQKLRIRIVPGSRVQYRLPANACDYLCWTRRVWGMTNKARVTHSTATGLALHEVYGITDPRSLAVAVAEDPPAATLLPYLLTLRLAGKLSADPNPTRTWGVIASTKEMD